MSRKKPNQPLSAADQKLWQAVTRDMTALVPNRAARPMIRRGVYRDIPPDPAPSYQPPVPDPGGAAPPDDYGQRKRRRGRLVPDGRLDLHGLTRDQAFQALVRYLTGAQDRGLRLILVITGKGRPREEALPHEKQQTRGILHHHVPLWLSQPPLASLIIAHYPATAVHGGDGALYVRIKRRKVSG